MRKKTKKSMDDKTPEVFSSIVLCFDKDANIENIVKLISDIGITDMKVYKPKYEDIMNVEFAIVCNEKFWCLDDAISKMFASVNSVLVEIKEIVKKFSGTIYINLSFVQFGTYPSIIFSKENIEKMAFLEADFGIDLY